MDPCKVCESKTSCTSLCETKSTWWNERDGDTQVVSGVFGTQKPKHVKRYEPNKNGIRREII